MIKALIFGGFHIRNGSEFYHKLILEQNELITDNFMDDAISFKLSHDRVRLQSWSDNDGFKKIGIIIEIPDRLELLRKQIMEFCFIIIVSDDLPREKEQQIRKKLSTFEYKLKQMINLSPRILPELHEYLSKF